MSAFANDVRACRATMPALTEPLHDFAAAPKSCAEILARGQYEADWRWHNSPWRVQTERALAAEAAWRASFTPAEQVAQARWSATWAQHGDVA